MHLEALNPRPLGCVLPSVRQRYLPLATLHFALGIAACESAARDPGVPSDAGVAGANADSASDAGACPALPEAVGWEAIVTGLTLPWAIAVDGEFVYWLQGQRRVQGGSALLRAPKEGGEPELLVDELEHPTRIVLTEQDVVWSEVGVVEDGFRGRVRSVPKSGGAAVVLADGLRFPWGVAADESEVFWTTHDEETEQIQLWARGHGSSGAARLLLAVPGPLTSSVPSGEIHATEGAIYWAISASTYGSHSAPGALGTPGVVRVPRDEPALAEVVVSGLNGDAAAIAGDDIYVVDRLTGVFRARAGSPDAPLQIAQVPRGLWLLGIAANENAVYWLEPNEVRSATGAASAELRTVAPEQPLPQGLSVDDAWLYWTVQGQERLTMDRSCGAIHRARVSRANP
jgi:hypothetical protein